MEVFARDNLELVFAHCLITVGKQQCDHDGEEKHDEAEADALINEYERSESALEDESFNDYRSQCIYEEWQDAGNPGYIESFEIGLMCESLSKEERERLLQVAKLMFPDAVYLTKD